MEDRSDVGLHRGLGEEQLFGDLAVGRAAGHQAQNVERIVTAAALVLSITFFAFAVSGITFTKMFGFGLGLAVLIDAFIVRATLVPALMKLAGKANWWAPAWARRLHERVGMDETAGPSSSERPEELTPAGR